MDTLILYLSSHTEIRSNDPFLALSNLSSLMQHAVIAMLMQQQHACLETDHNLLINRRLLEGNIVGIENRLAALATRRRRRQVQE